MRKNKTTIKSVYIDSFNYIKECKNFILIIIAIFLFSALIGLIVPLPEVLIQELIKTLKEILKQIEGKTTLGIIKFIFFNNLTASIFGLITGIFLGIIPILIAITNGYLLGFVSLISIQSEGIFSLWKILPHGIFELTAIFISLGLGLKLGTSPFQKNIKKELKKNIINSAKVFILIILPLLFIAAIIEGILIGLIN